VFLNHALEWFGEEIKDELRRHEMEEIKVERFGLILKKNTALNKNTRLLFKFRIRTYFY
jgi:hypothetical protein